MTQFNYTFLVAEKTIFEVNNERYFATSAAVFNHPNTDFDECGQCQDDVLPPGPARDFWEKWDYLHLSNLTEQQELDIIKDLCILKSNYRWTDSCRFSDQQQLVRNK